DAIRSGRWQRSVAGADAGGAAGDRRPERQRELVKESRIGRGGGVGDRPGSLRGGDAAVEPAVSVVRPAALRARDRHAKRCQTGTGLVLALKRAAEVLRADGDPVRVTHPAPEPECERAPAVLNERKRGREVRYE